MTDLECIPECVRTDARMLPVVNFILTPPSSAFSSCCYIAPCPDEFQEGVSKRLLEESCLVRDGEGLR